MTFTHNEDIYKVRVDEQRSLFKYQLYNVNCMYIESKIRHRK